MRQFTTINVLQMRVKYKNGHVSGILVIPDDDTVGSLFDKLKSLVGDDDFIIKYGLPAAMKSIGKNQKDQPLRRFRLNGETLTLASTEKPVDDSVDFAGHHSTKGDEAAERSSNDVGESCIAWPEREGTLGENSPGHANKRYADVCLVLRVMPSDNSCLFTAFGGALPEQILPQRLRRMMADYIQQNPDVYTDAVLGSPPNIYCQRILNTDFWGGGIELSILSTIFNIQICTFDVQVSILGYRSFYFAYSFADKSQYYFWREEITAMHIGILGYSLRQDCIQLLGLSI